MDAVRPSGAAVVLLVAITTSLGARPLRLALSEWRSRLDHPKTQRKAAAPSGGGLVVWSWGERMFTTLRGLPQVR